jgi:DNA-binding Xre family transcriptional regulator
MEFKDRLKELMDESGITEYRLSKILHCKQSTITNWRVL